jgi:hypothetical protein
VFGFIWAVDKSRFVDAKHTLFLVFGRTLLSSVSALSGSGRAGINACSDVVCWPEPGHATESNNSSSEPA